MVNLQKASILVFNLVIKLMKYRNQSWEKLFILRRQQWYLPTLTTEISMPFPYRTITKSDEEKRRLI